MRSPLWRVRVPTLDTEPVTIGVRAVIERRPRNFEVLQDEKTLKLPGFQVSAPPAATTRPGTGSIHTCACFLQHPHPTRPASPLP
jgi:hypothetical protein